ncbi:MAG: D-alanyl-D-alanine carboxypeptidase [Lachnospiraceae bacterium]|nr:D-alanyl-D-alanine carboxypeptidase [Lachnospiraceae bacterium]
MFRMKHLRLLAGALAACLVLSSPLSALADKASEKEERIAEHQAMAIQSNARTSWPAGPVVSAESAILIEAETCTILYEKNIHKKQYPASTTKILTALLAYEKSSLDETVTFSHDDIFSIPKGSNHISLNPGYTLSMEDCLRALLIRSANEVAYALAAHVGGSWDAFADMMNARAAELGAVDSHFANPNGLPNEDHYTSAYDLAMIGRAFFSIDYLNQITLEPKLVVEKPNGVLTDMNQMPLIPSGKYAYEFLIGCKTGYTDSAHNTMVACAEKNGMRLICVVLNDDNPMYAEDTIALFDYGFNNFSKVNVSQTETKYDIDNIGFFYDNTDIFGASEPLLSLNKDDCVILPKSANFSDLTSTISYNVSVPGQAALISYTFHGTPVGTVSLDLAKGQENAFTFETQEAPTPTPEAKTPAPDKKKEKEKAKDASKEKEKKTPSFVFVNLKILKALLILVIVAAVLFVLYMFIRRNIHFSFASGLKNSRNHEHAKAKLRASKEMQKSRKSQIRAAKKRYKERIKRR